MSWPSRPCCAGGTRRGLRAGFAFLNAWTLLLLPISWLLYGQGWAALIASFAMWVMGIATFLRMGEGRWYRTTGPGVGKALVALIALYAISLVGGMAITAIGLAAGLWF